LLSLIDGDADKKQVITLNEINSTVALMAKLKEFKETMLKDIAFLKDKID